MDLLFNSSNIVNFMLKSDIGETEGQILLYLLPGV